MSLPAYSAYRDSGVPWLGDIPASWSVERMSWLFDEISSGTTPDSKNASYYGGDVNWVTTGELRERGIAQTEKRLTDSALASHSALKIYSPGTLLIAMYGATIGRLGWLDEAACTNQACCAFARPRRVETRFAYYALSAARDHLVVLASGGGQPNINQDKLRSLRIALPSREEQDVIVRFLDRETAKIDALIAKQEQLIATLREDRTATITHAVTKGLDPNVEMKASGVTWIRTTPGHWDVVNIRRVAAMKTGHTPSRSVAAYWENTTIPWFTLADVWQLRDGKRIYLGETTSCISELGLANSAAELLPAGTVVFSRTASVGFSGIMPIPMATSQDFWNWICGPLLLPEYLVFVFRAMKDHFSALMMGSTHKTIYQADAATLRIPLPPLSEQQAIVQRIVSKADAFDALGAKAEEMIEALRDYRAALITDAVTGKIDVRGVA